MFKAKEFEGIKIIRDEASIYYANVENFVYKMVKTTGVRPAEIIEKINKKRAEHERLIRKARSGPATVSYPPQNNVYKLTKKQQNLPYILLKTKKIKGVTKILINLLKRKDKCHVIVNHVGRLKLRNTQSFVN